jgi:hypothetical protein
MTTADPAITVQGAAVVLDCTANAPGLSLPAT